MATTLIPVPAKALGAVIATHKSTSICQDGSVPSGTAAHVFVRNGKLYGPFSDLSVARDMVSWIESREREYGVANA